MKAFIANFGRENYLWHECHTKSTIAVLESEDLWPMREAGDRDAYIAYAVSNKRTAAGIAPTRPVASRWFNLHDVVADTSGDLWIHREKNELWWSVSKSEPPEVVIQPAHKPALDGDRIYVVHKPATRWSKFTRRGSRLEWPGLHARAREFLFTEGTLQQLAPDNAAYAEALINGDDLSSWHLRPSWLAKAEAARRNPALVLSAKQRTIARMAVTARETVAQSQGQIVQRTVKLKELRFPNAQVLESYIAKLLESQDGVCALTGIPSQMDGEHQELDLLCSLDRIDSSAHYEAGDLQIVCRFVNRWKNDSDDANFRRLLSLVRAVQAS